MTGNELKVIIRVFEDSTTEILEGESLQNFLTQQRAALKFLFFHSGANQEDKIEWLPVKAVEITR